MAVRTLEEIEKIGVVLCTNTKCPLSKSPQTKQNQCRACGTDLPGKEPKPDLLFTLMQTKPAPRPQEQDSLKRTPIFTARERKQFGPTIRNIRTSMELSREAFGIRCGGLLPSVVKDIEEGIRFPSNTIQERLARGLGISLEDLRAAVRTGNFPILSSRE